MIELAQSLDCWPPHLFSDPSGHLLKSLAQVVDYPVADSDRAIDLLASLRQRLVSWLPEETPGEEGPLRELYMKGDYQRVTKLFVSREGQASVEDQDVAYWSFVHWSNQLYQRALRAGDDEAVQLFEEIATNCAQALAIRKDGYEVLNNWGLILMEQARRSNDEDAPRLYAAAQEKYAAALEVRPDLPETLTNWGSLLSDRAMRSGDKEAFPLFAAAAEKFDRALRIKPDHPQAWYNWGNLYLRQAKRSSGEERSRLLDAAAEKLKSAAKIDLTLTYNLACLAALRGQEEQCREYLVNAENHHTLPSVEHLKSDVDLDSMRDKAWFKELLARQQRS